MTHSIEAAWKGNMMFDALVSGHHLVVDALPESGGENKGPRPKELMLVSLAGCTGMDVVSILKKMRIEPESFNVKVSAEVTEEHPKHYYRMHIIYEFKGNNLPMDKLEKAVELSQERYCGVSAAYRKGMEITHEIKVN
jgi:putative redox protein